MKVRDAANAHLLPESRPAGAHGRPAAPVPAGSPGARRWTWLQGASPLLLRLVVECVRRRVQKRTGVANPRGLESEMSQQENPARPPAAPVEQCTGLTRSSALSHD